MDHTEGTRTEGRAPPCPAEKGEPLFVQDVLLPWEIAGPCHALPLPPTADAPNADPPDSLPWEPTGPGKEPPPSPACDHDEELPGWLATEGAEAVVDDGNGTLLSMADLEALAAAELGLLSDRRAGVDDSTQRTVWGSARPEPRTETFDPEATVIRLPKPGPRGTGS